MADSGSCEEIIITTFLLNTCRINRCTNDALLSLSHCTDIAMENQSVDDEEAGFIPLISGSTAEIFIEPMLSCVNDVDVMLHRSNELAIPEHLPTTYTVTT